MVKPGLEMKQYGQSVWHDNLNRELVVTGELQRMVQEDGLSGGTFNSLAFQEVLTDTDLYVEQLQELGKQGQMLGEIYDGLTLPGIQQSADILRSVYEETNGEDGYASLEVSPLLAPFTDMTADAARKLWVSLGRPNAMIGIPGTELGLPAIERCLRERININVTLLFGVENYEQVAWTYITALEQCLADGQPIDRIASVASFGVTPVDIRIDNLLHRKIAAAKSEAGREKLRSLLGKAAIANAKIAYSKFKEIFTGPRWRLLKAKGAQVQRCLWASTTPNPDYPDVNYLGPLIGPSTVSTMALRALDNDGDRRRIVPTLEDGLDEAHETILGLAEADIDLKAVTEQLQAKAVEALGDAFEGAVEAIDSRLQVVW